MLGLLGGDKKKAVTIILGSKESKDGIDSYSQVKSDDSAGVEAAVASFISAIEKKDISAAASALRNAIVLCQGESKEEE